MGSRDWSEPLPENSPFLLRLASLTKSPSSVGSFGPSLRKTGGTSTRTNTWPGGVLCTDFSPLLARGEGVRSFARAHCVGVR